MSGNNTIVLFNVDSAEKIATRSFPLKILLQGSFSGFVMMTILVLVSSLLGPLGGLSNSSYLMMMIVSGIGFLLIIDIDKKLKSKAAKVFFWLYGLAFGIMLLASSFLIMGSLSTGSLGIFLNGFLYLPLCWMAFEISRGFLYISRSSPEDKIILKEHGYSTLSFKAFQQYLGIPEVINFMPGRSRQTVRIRFLFAAFLLSLALLSGMLGFQWSGILALQGYILTSLVSAVFSILLPLSFFRMHNVALDKARSKVRFSLSELINRDTRAPIVFLRSFRDDQVLLDNPQYSLFGKILASGLTNVTFDRILLEEGTFVGPVVALGNPKDYETPYGAARGYFDNVDWQSAVSKLIDSAAQVVICVDATESIWWEVNYIVQNKHLEKTLFLINPKYKDGAQNRDIVSTLFNQLSFHRQDRDHFLQENATHSHVLGFFIDENGVYHLCVSSIFSSLSYFSALRFFLRKNGGFLSLSSARTAQNLR